MELLRDGSTVLEDTLACDLNQSLLVQENQQIRFRGELALRRSDIQAIESFPVRITFGAIDDLGEAINKAITTIVAVTGIPDFCAIGYSRPRFLYRPFGFVFIQHSDLDLNHR